MGPGVVGEGFEFGASPDSPAFLFPFVGIGGIGGGYVVSVVVGEETGSGSVSGFGGEIDGVDFVFELVALAGSDQDGFGDDRDGLGIEEGELLGLEHGF